MKEARDVVGRGEKSPRYVTPDGSELLVRGREGGESSARIISGIEKKAKKHRRLMIKF